MSRDLFRRCCDESHSTGRQTSVGAPVRGGRREYRPRPTETYALSASAFLRWINIRYLVSNDRALTRCKLMPQSSDNVARYEMAMPDRRVPAHCCVAWPAIGPSRGKEPGIQD